MPITKPKTNLLKPGTHTSLRFRTEMRPDAKFGGRTSYSRQPIRIGGFAYGNIYVGSMRLQSKNKRVAIKRFISKIDDKKASQYQQTIEDLIRAGVRLPKMGMVKLLKGTRIGQEILKDDEWVQVSEFFGINESGQLKSKLVNKGTFKNLTENQKRLALIELIKVVNAGYTPSGDLIEAFISKDFILPFDLDVIVNRGKMDLETCVRSLLIFGSYSIHISYKELINLIKIHGSEDVKKIAFKLIQENIIPSISQNLFATNSL